MPLAKDSVRFVVIGDTGTGTDKQKQLADVMIRYKQAFPFEFVLMMGDNMYGGENPQDYKTKFENIYRPLLDGRSSSSLARQPRRVQPALLRIFQHERRGVLPLHEGQRRFYALNSNYMDKRQLKWLEEVR